MEIKKGIYSLTDAFMALDDLDDEVVTKELTEGKSFDVNDPEQVKAAKEYRDETKGGKQDVNLEVIDVDADAVDHLKDSKDYVGQYILQCNACKATHFVEGEDLKQDADDKDKYNLEDACPHCHSTGTGYTLVGQVGVAPSTKSDDEQEEESSDQEEEQNDEESDVKFDNDKDEEEKEDTEEETEEEDSDEDETEEVPDEDKEEEEDVPEDDTVELEDNHDDDEKNESVNKDYYGSIFPTYTHLAEQDDEEDPEFDEDETEDSDDEDVEVDEDKEKDPDDVEEDDTEDSKKSLRDKLRKAMGLDESMMTEEQKEYFFGTKKEVVKTEVDTLVENVLVANDLKPSRIGKVLSAETTINEAIRNKEDLEIIYNNFVLPTNDYKLKEEFKKVTGYKDELDEMLEKYNVEVRPRAFEIVESFTNRKALSAYVEELKNNNQPYTVKRSSKPGYRYDVVCESVLNEEPFNFPAVQNTAVATDEPEDVEVVDGELVDTPEADPNAGTDIVPADMDPRDVEVVQKIQRISNDIADAIHDTYNIDADPRLIVADIIQDLRLVSGDLSIEDLENTPINNLTAEMYRAYDGFYNALDELVSQVTGRRITTSQAERTRQAIASLDSPRFNTETIQQTIASPQFRQLALNNQVPYIDGNQLRLEHNRQHEALAEDLINKVLNHYSVDEAKELMEQINNVDDPVSRACQTVIETVEDGKNLIAPGQEDTNLYDKLQQKRAEYEQSADEFDEQEFDKLVNEQINKDREDVVLYETVDGSIDENNNIYLEGKVTDDQNNVTNVHFMLTRNTLNESEENCMIYTVGNDFDLGEFTLKIQK